MPTNGMGALQQNYQVVIERAVRRRTYRLTVEWPRTVKIVLPASEPDGSVSAIIRRHRRWIERRLEVAAPVPTIEGRSGERLLYRGAELVVATNDHRKGVDLSGTTLRVGTGAATGHNGRGQGTTSRSSASRGSASRGSASRGSASRSRASTDRTPAQGAADDSIAGGEMRGDHAPAGGADFAGRAELAVDSDNPGGADFAGGTRSRHVSSSALRAPGPAIERWLRDRCRYHAAEEIERWGPRVGRRPDRLRISGARTRWGSCSSRGTLSISWPAVMAPPEVFTYLVVHELCHLVHPNHSQRFWRLLERHLPDFQQSRQWLKDNDQLLATVVVA